MRSIPWPSRKRASCRASSNERQLTLLTWATLGTVSRSATGIRFLSFKEIQYQLQKCAPPALGPIEEEEVRTVRDRLERGLRIGEIVLERLEVFWSRPVISRAADVKRRNADVMCVPELFSASHLEVFLTKRAGNPHRGWRSRERQWVARKAIANVPVYPGWHALPLSRSSRARAERFSGGGLPC